PMLYSDVILSMVCLAAAHKWHCGLVSSFRSTEGFFRCAKHKAACKRRLYIVTNSGGLFVGTGGRIRIGDNGLHGFLRHTVGTSKPNSRQFTSVNHPIYGHT